ncbi:LysE family translocator [Motilimonas pumila]|uniref:LysE family translocator n=1 Tax=Motilimonas pumila TaxID=2303987 RepID=A0A418YCV0_9GAMM|nr:LysE family translocator [Motilimonas pumila]RJG42324.1 LysE family translocator [Motilimonas pumila]
MFESSLFISLVVFAFVTSITPGPNNIMLAASGANFGFRRTLPHMLGIIFGVAMMILSMGVGFAALFSQFAMLQWGLKVMGSAYLGYIAWQVWQAQGPTKQGEKVQPLTFLQAALFQWLNPKAWLMVITAISSFSFGQEYWLSLLLIASVFFVVEIPTTSFWALCGEQVSRLLTTPRHWRMFNGLMALGLLWSIYMMWQ